MVNFKEIIVTDHHGHIIDTNLSEYFRVKNEGSDKIDSMQINSR